MKLKLIGSKIVQINAEKNPSFEGKINLNTNINIQNVEDYESETSNIASLRVTASLKIEYGELGAIDIKGQLFVTGDTEEMESIKKSFNSKEFDNAQMVAIMNVVMQKFSIKAFELEEELGLPIHINLPSLKASKKDQ